MAFNVNTENKVYTNLKSSVFQASLQLLYIEID